MDGLRILPGSAFRENRGACMVSFHKAAYSPRTCGQQGIRTLAEEVFFQPAVS